MSRAGGTSIAADSSPRRKVAVDVLLLLTGNGRILLRERANTGYGDGAYEPPSGELAERETIVETAIRVARAAGIAISGENVLLAHVMHDVSGSGRIGFYLSVSGWTGEPTSPEVRWFPAGNLPTNMLDRDRVALRNYADGMPFSTYPAFAPASVNGAEAFYPVNGHAGGSSEAYESDNGNGLSRSGESHEANGVSGAEGFTPRAGRGARRKQAHGAGLPR
jgi:8-oxo-dGTP pyrophosphatase MutT (NUDIX family)